MIDLIPFIKGAGYLGVAAIVFAESGLLIGVVFPGDSLLFTAGILASQGFLAIIPLAVIAFVAAVSGDSAGYWIGKRFGRSAFMGRNSLLLNEAHVARAERFYDQYGPLTLVLARFVPVIRSIVPMMAGVGLMRYRTFFKYNLIGGILWGVGLVLTGYWLGSAIPNIDRYLLPIIFGIIVVSFLPAVWHLFKEWRKQRGLRSE